MNFGIWDIFANITTLKHLYIPHMKLPLLLISLLVGATAAQAVPAYPKPVSVRQPDGTTVVVRACGDERVHWTETPDGYTLLRDAEGFLTFARPDATGALQPSALRYDGTSRTAQLNGIRPHLRFSAEQVKQKRQAFQTIRTASVTAPLSETSVHTLANTSATPPEGMSIDATFPTSGKRKLLVLLVNFSDTKTTYTAGNFHNMMNAKGYNGTGSFRDYYLEQSHGQLDIDVTVTNWIQVPHAKAVYNTDNAQNLVVEALQMVADTLDLKQFDNDGDGVLDGLAVIHQGYGQEITQDTGDIWSHSTVIYGTSVGGVRVARYTIEPELLSGTAMANPGVICHEFGHNLGAPDVYDTDYSGSDGEFCGTGAWDLMGSGAWNGTLGTHPAGLNAWQKWVWGWVKAVELTEDATIEALGAAQDDDTVYKLSTSTEGDYFIMENRQQRSFDAALPGHGLLIYHVNENIIKDKLQTNDINATYPQGLYTLCSDAGVDPDLRPASFGNVNSATTPFPSEYGHTEFTDFTLPSSHSIEGRYAYCGLHHIGENADGTVTFAFRREAEPASPAAFQALTQDGNVHLSWSEPAADDLRSIDHYNIYRDKTTIARTKELAFTDLAAPTEETLSYEVDATYTDSLKSRTQKAQVRVPGNKITGLTATSQDDGVHLQWDIAKTLQRADVFNDRLLMFDDYTDEVEVANLYTPADLSTYVGSTITRMGFVPLQGPSTLAAKLRIYEGNADGSNPQLVSERTVKEFAAAQLRDIKLTQPVTIREGHSYWLALNLQPTNGYVTLACDSKQLTPGRGNLVWEDGRFVEVEQAQGNFYVTATLTTPSASTPAKLETMDFADQAFDVDLDLIYPRAFSVYCDGQLLGQTTALSTVVSGLEGGTHQFKVACRYAGNNESAAVTAEVQTTDAISQATTPSVSISSSHGHIIVTGAQGHIYVADASGRTCVFASAATLADTAFAPGVYVVKANRVSQKVVVE